MIHQAVLRSSLDYGCVVFGSAAKTILSKLDRVQARALRICCGAFKTTSIPALLVEMGESTLEIRRNKLGIHYWSKLSGYRYSAATKCLLQSCWKSMGREKKANFFFQNIRKLAVSCIGLDQDSVRSSLVACAVLDSTRS